MFSRLDFGLDITYINKYFFQAPITILIFPTTSWGNCFWEGL